MLLKRNAYVGRRPMSCQHIFMFVLRQLGARSAGHLCSQDFDSTFTVPSFTPLASASFYILHHVSYCNYCTHDAFQICLVRLRWWATVDADVLVSTTCQAKLARLSRSIVAETRDLYDLCSSFVDSHLCNFQKPWETACWNVRRVSMRQLCQLVHLCLFAFVWKLQICAQGALNLTLIKTMTLGSIFCVARILGLK